MTKRLEPIDTSKYKITETGQVLKRTKDELKDEMKDKISMALKDPVLQQGFEIICKNLAELEKEKCELLGIIQGKDKVIQELKKAYKTGFQDGYNKAFVEADKNLKAIVTDFNKAKELIKEMLSILPKENIEGVYEITEEAEQFLRENE